MHSIETGEPQNCGFDVGMLEEAVAFAISHESTMDRDIGAALDNGHFGEPWPEYAKTVGPVKPRHDPNGVILRKGKLVKTWGDPTRVDMTFSISKSYLALCAGVAVDQGLIPDVNAPVRDLVADGGFDSPQNQPITWAQLLQLTSEWEGELWGKPDWLDHNRDLNAKPGAPSKKGQKRAMKTPGSFWEYNDVRVNQLSYALMRVFKRPLPEVLKEHIMDPIGASESWEWHGYDTSWVDMEGRLVQGVSGGGHWGGGLWINSLDHARVGQMMLHGGAFDGTRVLSQDWVEACKTPCALNPNYGFFWWLNTGQSFVPAAPESSFFGLGVGTNILWVDPEHDMVVVARWLEKSSLSGFVQKVLAALT